MVAYLFILLAVYQQRKELIIMNGLWEYRQTPQEA